MTNSFGLRLFSRGVVAMIGLMGALCVAPGCGSDQTPVAPGASADVKVVGPTLNKKKLKLDVGSRRQHQKEQAQQKGSAGAAD